MKKKLLAMMMALVMVFGLIACGGGDTAEPTKAPEATKTEATKAPEATKAADPTKAPVAEQPSNEEEIDISNWTCYAGILGEESEGDYIYYVFSEDGTRGGLMLLLTEVNGSVSVFGDYGVDAETGYEYLVDDETGLTIYFSATLLDNGEYLIDLGNLGTAQIGAAEAAEVIEAMDTILENTEDVTEVLIEELRKAMEEEQNTATGGNYAARTIPDVTGWTVYAGSVEQPGDFVGATLVFAHNPNADFAGMVAVDGATGDAAYLFGEYLYEEGTGLSYIYDEGADLAAVFTLMDIGMEGVYYLDMGALGQVAVVSQSEDILRSVIGLANATTNDETEAFLVALASGAGLGNSEENQEGMYFFSGVMDNGNQVYYSRMNGGTYNTLIIIEGDNAVFAQGTTTYDAATKTETITDEMFGGDQFFYQLEKIDGGYQLVFAGGRMGTVNVWECTEYEYMQAEEAFHMTKINAEFAKELNK